MKTTDFDYSLPPHLIAQTPIESRDQSRLMVLDRADGSIRHHRFYELVEFLRPGDVLVFNDSRVIRARLFGRKADTGKELEILLLRRLRPNVWETLVRSKKRLPAGTKIEMGNDAGGTAVTAEVAGLGEGGVKVLSFSDETVLPYLGKVPLPPYIHAPLADPERYQTVYAEKDGSVAAPTAGLHFTPELMQRIKDKGAKCVFVTLHVGLNTFRPIREEDTLEHPIYPEFGIVSRTAARELTQAKSEKRRIICVGTTVVRLVEAIVQDKTVPPFEDWVNLFILPGYRFGVVDAMITNFHLPKSTLLMLVSAFAGKDRIKQAYEEAIAREYRFYSFGDAMLIL